MEGLRTVWAFSRVRFECLSVGMAEQTQQNVKRAKNTLEYRHSGIVTVLMEDVRTIWTMLFVTCLSNKLMLRLVLK